MSKIIEIIEENNELKLLQSDAKIICGNSNYKLKFTFSEDWKKATHKAVVFCVCGKKITQTMVYDECEVPVLHGGGVLFVSLVAGNEGNELATTEVKIDLVETFSNVDFVEFEPLRNDLSSLLDAVNNIERGNIAVKKAEIANNVSNPNLLINGDFKVNQRGGTTYTEAGKYTVDRWKLVSGSVEIKSNGIMLNGIIVQKLEHSPSVQVVASSNAGTISYSNGAVTLSTTTATLITYAKLEIGTTATPFSPLLYAEELTHCQRFYWKLSPQFSYGDFCLMTYISNGTKFIGTINLPQTMRTNPTFTASNISELGFRSLSGVVSSLAKEQYQENQVILVANVTGATNAVNGQSYYLRSGGIRPVLEIDAEIY